MFDKRLYSTTRFAWVQGDRLNARFNNKKKHPIHCVKIKNFLNCLHTKDNFRFQKWKDQNKFYIFKNCFSTTSFSGYERYTPMCFLNYDTFYKSNLGKAYQWLLESYIHLFSYIWKWIENKNSVGVIRVFDMTAMTSKREKSIAYIFFSSAEPYCDKFRTLE